MCNQRRTSLEDDPCITSMVSYDIFFIHVELWNCVRTKLKINLIKRTKISSIISRMHAYNVIQQIINTTTTDKKISNANL